MILFMVALWGLVLGSFVNALVWRLHEQASLQDKNTAKARKRLRDVSISHGRSMCPTCSHTLAAKDLVPVLSWVSLRGKCRYCKVSISWQYPLVELLTSGLFMLSYATWPYSLVGVLDQFALVVWFVVLVFFMALAVYDIRWYLLPDRLVAPLTGVAMLFAILRACAEWDIVPLGYAVLGAVLFFGFFWLLYQISDGKWIGGGDVKIALALGLLVGTPLRAGLVLFGASLIGTFASLPSLIRSKDTLKAYVPFGPWLLTATVLVVLYGQRCVDWYNNLAGL